MRFPQLSGYAFEYGAMVLICFTIGLAFAAPTVAFHITKEEEENMPKDLSELSHDERLARDPQFRAEWEGSRVVRHNAQRSEDDHDFHDELWLRSEIIKAGDRKSAEMLLAASREIARLEAENARLHAKLGVAVAAMTKNRPLPERGME